MRKGGLHHRWMHYLSKRSLYLYFCTDGLKTTNNFLRKGDSHYDEQQFKQQRN